MNPRRSLERSPGTLTTLHRSRIKTQQSYNDCYRTADRLLTTPEMSAALIHDKLFIKTFWEKKINNHNHMIEAEDDRMKKSALTKLRDEWLMRLETRTKHLKNFGDNRGSNPASA